MTLRRNSFYICRCCWAEILLVEALPSAGPSVSAICYTAIEMEGSEEGIDEAADG